MNTINQSIKTRRRRIRYITKYRIHQIIPQQIHHRLGQQSTQLLALMVNRLVIAPAEINALKTAAHPLRGLQNIDLLHMATLTHQQRIARTQFLHILRIDVERRLYRRALTRHHNHFIVDVVVRRTYPRRIANDKRIAVTQHPNHVISAIHVFETALQNVGQRYFLFDFFGDLQVGEPLRLQNTKQTLVFLVDEMTNLLQHQHVIALLLGLLSQFNQRIEQLIRIGNVVIPRQHQIAGHPVVLTQKRMYVLDAVPTVCTVAQMSQKHFTRIWIVLSQVISVFAILLRNLIQCRPNLLKNVR